MTVVGAMAMEAPADRVHITPLAARDAIGVRVRRNTVVHVRSDLPVWAQAAAAGELLRHMHSIGDSCVSVELPLDTAVTLPKQRGLRSVRLRPPACR